MVCRAIAIFTPKRASATPVRPCRAGPRFEPDGRATLTFDDPQYGVSAGQAAVLYTGTRLLGGGWIART